MIFSCCAEPEPGAEVERVQGMEADPFDTLRRQVVELQNGVDDHGERLKEAKAVLDKLDEPETRSAFENAQEKIEKLSTAVQAVTDNKDKVQSGEPLKIAEGALSMVAGLAGVLPELSPMLEFMGPVGALCGLVSGILSCLDTDTKKSPMDVLMENMRASIEEVRTDLEELHDADMIAEYHASMDNARLIISDLNRICTNHPDSSMLSVGKTDEFCKPLINVIDRICSIIRQRADKKGANMLTDLQAQNGAKYYSLLPGPYFMVLLMTGLIDYNNQLLHEESVTPAEARRCCTREISEVMKAIATPPMSDAGRDLYGAYITRDGKERAAVGRLAWAMDPPILLRGEVMGFALSDAPLILGTNDDGLVGAVTGTTKLVVLPANESATVVDRDSGAKQMVQVWDLHKKKWLSQTKEPPTTSEYEDFESRKIEGWNLKADAINPANDQSRFILQKSSSGWWTITSKYNNAAVAIVAIRRTVFSYVPYQGSHKLALCITAGDGHRKWHLKEASDLVQGDLPVDLQERDGPNAQDLLDFDLR